MGPLVALPATVGGLAPAPERVVARCEALGPRAGRAPHRRGGHPGLLLTAAPFPDGGVHGGHTIAIWNQRGHGYVLSLHRRSVADVLAAAEAMSRG